MPIVLHVGVQINAVVDLAAALADEGQGHAVEEARTTADVFGCFQASEVAGGRFGDPRCRLWCRARSAGVFSGFRCGEVQCKLLWISRCRRSRWHVVPAGIPKDFPESNMSPATTDEQPEFRGFFRQYCCLLCGLFERAVQVGIGHIYRETQESQRLSVARQSSPWRETRSVP